MRDGLKSADDTWADDFTAADDIVASDLISGANIVVTGSVISENRQLTSCGIGSPSTWDFIVQAGSNTTGAGSNAWVSFGTAFSSTPQSVVISPTEVIGFSGLALILGSTNAGSFYAESEVASVTFNWMAAGPK